MAADTYEITSTDWEGAVEPLREWQEIPSTGEEYTRALELDPLAQWVSVFHRMRAHLGGGIAAGAPALQDSEESSELRALALAIARETPHVEVAARAPIALTDNLVDDVRTVTGLRYIDIADLFGISERAVAGWREAGAVPRNRTALLQALRSIGLVLVGGLGAEGVANWLRAGDPISRLTKLRSGNIEDVVGEAREYEFSPAT